jgi:hypothetical protein
MAKLKTYKIPVSWTVTATIEVVAHDLDEAFAIAGDPSFPNPTDGEYLDDSFKIDAESLDCVNTNKSILKEIKNHPNL